MRNIEWHLKIDPETFQPFGVCVVDGITTDVKYGVEYIVDVSVHVDREELARLVRSILDEELKAKTDLTEEERAFAVGDGFKMKPVKWEPTE